MSQVVKWTALAEAPPPEDGPYLVYAPSADPARPLVAKAWYDPGSGWLLLPAVWAGGVTHWMPLPDPPEGKIT